MPSASCPYPWVNCRHIYGHKGTKGWARQGSRGDWVLPIYIYIYVYSSGLWSAPIMAKPLGQISQVECFSLIFSFWGRSQKNLQRHARAAADFASVSQCQKICILYTYDHYYFAYHSLLLAKHVTCAVRNKCCWWVVKSILRFCAGTNPLYNGPFSYSAIAWINSHF